MAKAPDADTLALLAQLLRSERVAALGTLVTGLGLAGALSNALDDLLPPFADKTNAWICAAFGALMVTYAAAQIVRWAIASARRA
jgi:hypothetical protein